jgi:aminoglycoside phosphotransferase family enzyme/predicted kinase
MQNEVEAFLAATPVSGAPVTRIDTHAAIVFLSGERALKIKRAVKLPFLDFSTLGRRKTACDAEFAANKPFAPTIYRRIVPITRELDGTLKIDGAGPPVEWALEMLRFDENATLDKLAERGAIDSALAVATADAITTSHSLARIADHSGWTRSIPAIIRQNAEAFRVGGVFPAADQNEIETLSRRAFEHNLPLIEQRAAHGFVRRCHGDLHLANLVLIDGRPVLFDALEFDESLATIDVLHDLSFPLMDLVLYGCKDGANIVLNRYLDVGPLDNLAALGLLPLFMSLRAAVRANVLCVRSAQETRNQTTHRRAKAYFGLARSVLTPPQPMLIAVGGLSGTGKSAVARRLAPNTGAMPGAIILRSDVIRKRMLGGAELDRLPPEAYRPDIAAKVYSNLMAEAEAIIRQGHTVIVDAMFAREDERSGIEKVAANAGLRFIGLFLTADLAIRCERIGHRVGDASDATIDVARAQEDYALGTIDWHRIDASGRLDQTAERCAQIIGRTGLRAANSG